MDLFVVPTIGFDLLYGFVIVRLARRDLVWINVTTNPTAEWIARQITEAFPWNEAPRYLIRDRDRIYGAAVTRRLRAMGIRDKPIAPGSPWQNGFAERLIGSIRRECVDHIVVLGEAHLRRILRSYAAYYNEMQNTPIVGQRCAGLAPSSADRKHSHSCAPRRPPSPLRQSLGFRYTHPQQRASDASSGLACIRHDRGSHRARAAIYFRCSRGSSWRTRCAPSGGNSEPQGRGCRFETRVLQYAARVWSRVRASLSAQSDKVMAAVAALHAASERDQQQRRDPVDLPALPRRRDFN